MKTFLRGKTPFLRSEKLQEYEAGRLVTQLKNLGYGNVAALPLRGGERYIVTAEPKDKTLALSRLQERNNARVVSQFQDLKLGTTPSGAHFVENLKSGGIYVVTETSCTCPHQQMRQSGSGLLCKHIQYFKMVKALLK